MKRSMRSITLEAMLAFVAGVAGCSPSDDSGNTPYTKTQYAERETREQATIAQPSPEPKTPIGQEGVVKILASGPDGVVVSYLLGENKIRSILHEVNYTAAEPDFFIHGIGEGYLSALIENDMTRRYLLRFKGIDREGKTIERIVYLIDNRHPTPSGEVDKVVVYGRDDPESKILFDSSHPSGNPKTDGVAKGLWKIVMGYYPTE